MQINTLIVPVDVMMIYTLDSGETITISSRQVTSRRALERGNAIAPRQTWEGEEMIGGIEVMSTEYRAMLDAYFAGVQADITNHEGNPIFHYDMTLNDYRDVWALPELADVQYGLLDGGEPYKAGAKFTIRELILEAVYRANPRWDPFRSEETGESIGGLSSYSGVPETGKPGAKRGK